MANSIMYLSKAGSGKTYKITHSLQILKSKKILYITFTNNNADNLRVNLLDSKSQITSSPLTQYDVETFFEFLWDEFIMPFRPSIEDEKGLKQINGLDFTNSPKRYIKSTDTAFWQNSIGELYSSKLTKLITSTSSFDKGISRLQRFIDYIVIDEFQDISNPDLKIIQKILQNGLRMILVGDLYQSAVDSTGKGKRPYQERAYITLGEEEFVRKTLKFRKKYMDIDTTTLKKSRRVTADVCDWINRKLNIPIESCSKNPGSVKLVTENKIISALNSCTQILVWDKQVKRKIISLNPSFENKICTWGASKGLTFSSISVIMTSKVEEQLDELESDDSSLSKFKSINKFYVAMTRSQGNVYLIRSSDLGHLFKNSKVLHST